MPLPSEAEIRAQIDDVTLIYDEVRKFGHVNGSGLNWESMEDALTQSLETPYGADVLRAVAADRAALASIISSRGLRAKLDPLILTYAQVLGINARDAAEAVKLIAEDLAERATAQTIQTRAFTFGSVSAGGSNVGTGTVNRLTTGILPTNGGGYDAYAIENTHADTKTIECVRDVHSGATKHEEIFEIRGGQRADLRDSIEITGSGLVAQMRALSGRDTLPYLRNPSFSTHTGTDGSTSAISDWTAATGSFGTELQIDDTTTYRDYQGSPNDRSLKFAGNGKVTQALTVQGGRFDPDAPYYCQLAYNRAAGSGDGTLTLRLGAVSKAVALSAQTGWNILRIDLNEDCWFRSWNENGADLEIELSSRTTGSVLVDDVILAPFTRFDGLWYAVVGGATKFLAGDTFSFADSETGAKLQAMLWRAYGTGDRYYFPHSGTPVWADPT